LNAERLVSSEEVEAFSPHGKELEPGALSSRLGERKRAPYSIGMELLENAAEGGVVSAGGGEEAGTMIREGGLEALDLVHRLGVGRR